MLTHNDTDSRNRSGRRRLRSDVHTVVRQLPICVDALGGGFFRGGLVVDGAPGVFQLRSRDRLRRSLRTTTYQARRGGFEKRGGLLCGFFRSIGYTETAKSEPDERCGLFSKLPKSFMYTGSLGREIYN